MSVMESLKDFPNKGAILVTTPQLVSVNDVRREVTFCEKLKIPIFGIVENYSSFKCPNCDVRFDPISGNGTYIAIPSIQ
jgi:Mrp family chromosome partitioning ATPase